MTKGRVLEVTERKTSQGKPIFDVNVQEGNETKKYQCWDAIIKEKQGKEVEFTIKESANPNFPTPTMMLPKGDGSSGFKKPFTAKPYVDHTRENTALMCSKDLMVELLKKSTKAHTPVEVGKATLVIARMFHSFLHDDHDGANKPQQEDKKVTAEQVANAVGGKVVDEQDIAF